jgi:hypothetical protein
MSVLNAFAGLARIVLELAVGQGIGECQAREFRAANCIEGIPAALATRFHVVTKRVEEFVGKLILRHRRCGGITASASDA